MKRVSTFILFALFMAGGVSHAESLSQEFEGGWSAQVDLGAFFTLAGYKNVREVTVMRESIISNIQMYQGITVGYDLSDSFFLGARLGNGYNGGLAREANPMALEDYALTFMGLDASYSWGFAERLSLEVSAGGGGVLIVPGLMRSDPEKVDQYLMGGYVAGGLGLMYSTLLTGFSTGIEVTFNYLLTDKIPSLSFTIPIKYGF